MEDNIIKALGIESLPDDQKAKILEQASHMVEARLLLRLTKHLDETKREELIKVLDTKDKDNLSEFIYKEVPEFTTWVEEETMALRDELMDLGKVE